MKTHKKYILLTQHAGEALQRRHVMRLFSDAKARGVAALRVKISSRQGPAVISWTLYAQHIDNLGKRLFIIDAGEFSELPEAVAPGKFKRATEHKKIFKRATADVR
jgi:hypothetical protein